MIIYNAKLMNGQTVDIAVKDGVITEIAEKSSHRLNGLTIAQGNIDATGLFAFPGGIDLHTHPRTPGARHKEDWPNLVRAALRGGTTTICCIGNNTPCWTTIDMLEQQHQEVVEAGYKENILLWVLATPDNLGEIKKALKKRYVIGTKIFLGSGPKGAVISDYMDFWRIAQVNAHYGKPVAVHTEVEELMQKNLVALGREPIIPDHGLIHATDAEVRGVKLGIEACKETGCMIIFFHLTCKPSIDLAAEAGASGFPIYIETCPHYFVFDESKLNGPDGGFYKVNPALRTREQADYVRESIKRGMIDLGDSDHAPHTREEKSFLKYGQVPSGMPGAEERMTIFLDLVNRRILTPQQFVNLTSANAAGILNLRKGKIEPKYDADVVLVDMSKKRRFSNGDVLSKCGWSAYHGMTFQGVPRFTIVGGRLAWSSF